MSEWWTYSPHDFLMFSPPIYWRLYESLNLAWWPLQLPMAAAALALLHPRAQAWMPALMALAWAVCGWAFMWQRYTPIQWVAGGFAWAFALQAVAALALLGFTLRQRDRPLPAPSLNPLGARVARLVVIAALLVYPLLAAMAGRPWLQAECFGLAPDPTALFSLALGMIHPRPAGRMRWVLRGMMGVPLAWCAFSSATLLVMGAWQGAALAGLVLLLLLAQVPTRRAEVRRTS